MAYKLLRLVAFPPRLPRVMPILSRGHLSLLLERHEFCDPDVQLLEERQSLLTKVAPLDRDRLLPQTEV